MNEPYPLGPFLSGMEEMAAHKEEEKRRKERGELGSFIRPTYRPTFRPIFNPPDEPFSIDSLVSDAVKLTAENSGLAYRLSSSSSGSDDSDYATNLLASQRYSTYSRSRTKSTPKTEENEGWLLRFGNWLLNG